jgi:crotonobetaine/carnitine-CoA ligase
MPMDIVGERTLYSTFADFAEQGPDREWLVFERGDGEVSIWTYGEFLDSVHRTVNLLDGLGIHKGDVFDLHLSNHPASVQLILAASYIGATAMPTNPISTLDELTYLVEHSESRAIFTDPGSLDLVNQVAEILSVSRVVVCDDGTGIPDGYLDYSGLLETQVSTPKTSPVSSDSVVQLLYTSGTTARPKGVMLTNRCLIYGAEVFRAATGLREDDCHLIALPLYHAAAQCHALWPSIVAGCRVALMSRFSASRFFEQAVTYGGTMAALFGAPLRMLLNQPERDTDTAHAIRNITFAQSLTEAQYEVWHHRFRAPLQQLWGMTETCSLPVMSPLSGERRLKAMGKPVLGYEVRVVDDEGDETRVGEPGELIVKGVPGKTLMQGYLKNEEATSQTLRTHVDGVWLHSGDTVGTDADGYLYFLDRGKDLIKRAGENISSIEIETAIMDCEGVLDVCVVGVPDDVRDESVVAVVVSANGTNVSEENVVAFCSGRLASFKVPDRVVFRDVLPRTSVGKIQKQAVREWLSKN